MRGNGIVKAAVLLLACVGVLAVAQPAPGDLIAYEPFIGYEVDPNRLTTSNVTGQDVLGVGFDNPDTPPVVPHWQLQNGHPNAICMVKPGGMTYSKDGADLLVSGDQHVDQFDIGDWVRAPLEDPITSGVVYMSCLAMAPSSQGEPSGTYPNGTYSWGPMITVNVPNKEPQTSIARDDAVHLVVFRIDLDAVDGEDNPAPTYDIWMDPVPGSSEDANGAATHESGLAGVTSVTHFVARGGNALQYDEVRFGETWEDVTPREPSGIVAGDTNEDGVVDAADYMALKENLGTGSGASQADGDVEGGSGPGQDGDVDWADLDLMAGALNGDAGGAVPEPASVALLLVGAAGLLRRRRA